MIFDAFNRCSVKLKRSIFRPRVPITRRMPVARLGSSYGGWEFVDHPSLHGATIVSAGAGEDISFDIDFLNAYGGIVCVVDPTPRALEHVECVVRNLGRARTQPYKRGGAQPIQSYDLENLSPDQIHVQPLALWIEKTKLRFYLPRNKSHVSHSIINFQNEYSNQAEFIEVNAATISDILDGLGLKELELLKLDIEGAEVEVIRHMLNQNILPRQLLVEFDEMNVPSARSKRRTESTYRLLVERGYHLVHFDGRTNFSFVRQDVVDELAADG